MQAIKNSQVDRLIWTPEAAGSACFLVAGWIAYRSVHKARAVVHHGPEWRVAAINLLGCVLFGDLGRRRIRRTLERRRARSGCRQLHDLAGGPLLPARVAAPDLQTRRADRVGRGLDDRGDHSRRAAAGLPEADDEVDPHALMHSRQFLVLLVLSAIVGLVASLVAWAFLELVNLIQTGAYEDLPTDVLGFDKTPVWWPVPLLVIGGLIVAFAIAKLPGQRRPRSRRRPQSPRRRCPATCPACCSPRSPASASARCSARRRR